MNEPMAGLHCESFGVGPDVVMVHGWAMHSGLWRDFAGRLAANFRVTLIDLPGHGLSAEGASFTLDAVTDALLASAPRPAHWLGWSLGGLFALHAASREPQAVLSVGLMAATPRFTACPGWPGVSAELLDAMADDFEQDFSATLKRFIALQTLGQDHARQLARHIEASAHGAPSPGPEAVRGGLKVLRETDLRSALVELSQPLLAVLGGRDRLVPARWADALSAIGPDRSVLVLPGAAHVPFLTHPVETAERVLGFLSDVEAAA